MKPPADLSNCHFLPLKCVEKVIDRLNKSREFKPVRGATCTRSLLELQENKNVPLSFLRGDSFLWKRRYYMALRTAICSHDWDKLQKLLVESPIWEHHSRSKRTYQERDYYIRALIILLMYHPSARAQNLLHQYMHMVLGCRTDEDKKALTKLLVAIPEKYIQRNLQNYEVKALDDDP